MNHSIFFLPLLFTHIISGFSALTTALLAISSKKGGGFHKITGDLFVMAMTGILLTAIPLSYMTEDSFLFLIALFSYYFTISGFFYAKHRDGIASHLAWLASALLLVVGISMLVYVCYFWQSGNYQTTVLSIFGLLAITNSLSDMKTYHHQLAKGRVRIIKHLSAMLGATIAVITAFTVVNITTHPAYLAWLAPAACITPFVYWWKYRVQSGKFTLIEMSS